MKNTMKKLVGPLVIGSLLGTVIMIPFAEGKLVYKKRIYDNGNTNYSHIEINDKSADKDHIDINGESSSATFSKTQMSWLCNKADPDTKKYFMGPYVSDCNEYRQGK